jgi:hypothetical protein
VERGSTYQNAQDETCVDLKFQIRTVFVRNMILILHISCRFCVIDMESVRFLLENVICICGSLHDGNVKVTILIVQKLWEMCVRLLKEARAGGMKDYAPLLQNFALSLLRGI